MALSGAKKYLELIDHSIGLHRKWSSRTTLQRGVEDFLAGWSFVNTYADAGPHPVALQCEMLFHLALEVEATSGS